MFSKLMEHCRNIAVIGVNMHLPLPVPLLQPPVPFCELSPASRLFSNDLAMLLY